MTGATTKPKKVSKKGPVVGCVRCGRSTRELGPANSIETAEGPLCLTWGDTREGSILGCYAGEKAGTVYVPTDEDMARWNKKPRLQPEPVEKPEPEPENDDEAKALDFLFNYRGSFSFLLDVQLRVFGAQGPALDGEQMPTPEIALSPKQIAAVLRCAARETKPAQRETPKADEPQVEAEVPNGFFTVDMGDGSHVTLRLKTWNEKQIATYLAGSDNENDYVGFAFVNGRRFNVWRKFAANENSRIVEALRTLLQGDPGEAGLRYAMTSSNCFRCGRRLTVPASIHAGLGPECAKM